ncbi:MAG: hypothetical protein NTV87_12030 [Ignavibacteriae bacterium]|nr:hypothetical protein [Ignavibacteriota bacterium]
MKKFYKIFTLTLFSFLIVNFSLKVDNCYAQWVQSYGIYGGPVWSLASLGNNVFAETPNSGVHFSWDDKSDCTQTDLNNQTVTLIAIHGNNKTKETEHI